MERNDELMHYGVPGMKWGVRRAKKAYANAYSKGDTEKLAKLDTKMQKNSAKAQRKVNKLEKKYPKLKTDVDRHIRKTDIKAASLEREATRQRAKAYGRFQTKKGAERALYEANKLQARSAELKTRSESAKAKLEANKNAQALFKQGIGEMSALRVDKGRKLLEYSGIIDKAKRDHESGKISGREKRDIIRKNKADRYSYLNSL